MQFDGLVYVSCFDPNGQVWGHSQIDRHDLYAGTIARRSPQTLKILYLKWGDRALGVVVAFGGDYWGDRPNSHKTR